MTLLLVNTLNLGAPTPQPNATVMSLYKYAPPTPSNNTPPRQPNVQLSSLGSVNQGKLAGPAHPPYGPAIPGRVPPQSGFGQ